MRTAIGRLVLFALMLPPASSAFAQNPGPGVLRAALGAPPAQAQPAHDDPLWDGIALGAVIGAGTSLGLTAISFARCNEGCEAPEPGPFYAISAVIGGVVGGVTGWLIDRAKKPTPGRTVRLAPILTKPRKGVALTVTF